MFTVLHMCGGVEMRQMFGAFLFAPASMKSVIIYAQRNQTHAQFARCM